MVCAKERRQKQKPQQYSEAQCVRESVITPLVFCLEYVEKILITQKCRGGRALPGKTQVS